MKKTIGTVLIGAFLAGCGGQNQVAPVSVSASRFSASEAALRAVRAPADRTIHYTAASRITDPSQFKVTTAERFSKCVIYQGVRRDAQSNRSPECASGGGGGSLEARQDGFDFLMDTSAYVGDAYDSTRSQTFTHVTSTSQGVNIAFPTAGMTVSEPVIAAESIPTDQWVQVYDSQVYISSNGYDAWISGSDGNAYALHDNGNQTMTVTNSSTGSSFTVAWSNYPTTYAMTRGRNRLHAACAVGWAAAGSITAVAFLGGVRAARMGGAVLLFPGGGYVEAGIFALGAAFSGYAAYQAFCRANYK